MCGLNGAYAFHGAAPAPDLDEILRTRDYMSARGPDSSGVWSSFDQRAAFGHRGLAIQDLTASGHQPMVSQCGRYCVVFNGEIYNYPELRRSLEAQGRVFSRESDTEVLLHLFDLYWSDMVRRLRGMFAFAIWSEDSRSLFLARDPYGIKPLYTSCDGRTFRFTSQIKAPLAGGAISQTPDPAGAVGFFLWRSVPEHFTLFRQIVARGSLSGH